MLAGWPRFFRGGSGPFVNQSDHPGAPARVAGQRRPAEGGAGGWPAGRFIRGGTPVSDDTSRSRASKGGGKADTQVLPLPKDVEDHRREVLKDLIRRQVLHDLGEPAGLLRVQVRPLWGAYYRVNVLVGAEAACARIPHSYFVAADGDGNILESSPKVRREY